MPQARTRSSVVMVRKARRALNLAPTRVPRRQGGTVRISIKKGDGFAVAPDPGFGAERSVCARRWRAVLDSGIVPGPARPVKTVGASVVLRRHVTIEGRTCRGGGLAHRSSSLTRARPGQGAGPYLSGSREQPTGYDAREGRQHAHQVRSPLASVTLRAPCMREGPQPWDAG